MTANISSKRRSGKVAQWSYEAASSDRIDLYKFTTNSQIQQAQKGWERMKIKWGNLREKIILKEYSRTKMFITILADRKAAF